MLAKIHSLYSRWSASLGAGLSCLLFIGLGLMVIPYPGIQNDEALFAMPLYAPRYWEAKIRAFHTDMPIMLMSYVGTLKTWLYVPWLWLWTPSAISIRLPVLLAGAATIWLFFALLMRVSGRRAALAGAILLATDVSFLLTTCFDWGPVALQHLLLVSGLLLLVKFHQEGANWAFALGFLVMGLGLWDKTLFAWDLVALAVASILAVPREMQQHLSAGRVATATLCFLLGASPLMVYNFESRGGTFRAYSSTSFKDFRVKVWVLEHTLDGSVLQGYLTSEDSLDHPRSPRSTLERASVWLSEKVGRHRNSLNSLALLVAVGLAPFLWRQAVGPALRFTLVFLPVAWLQMAMVTGAGAAAHHVILLWPFPILLVAVVFSEVSRHVPRRWGATLLATVVLLLAGGNLLVYNQYLAQLIRNGETGSWTDAVFPLSKRLVQYGAKQIYVIDWGMLDSLRLLTKGGLLLNAAIFPSEAPELSQDQRRILRSAVADPSHLFLAWTEKLEQFKGVRRHLAMGVCEAGYQRVLMDTIEDRNGRPVFEIFRFEKLNDQNRSTCD